jgi:hypothetical protein
LDDQNAPARKGDLAKQMHVATGRRMLRSGQLPAMKLGPKEWHIPSDALQDFINGEMKRPAATEKEGNA